jgi:hypothetical protein
MPAVIDSTPITQRPAHIDGLIDCFLEAASSKAGASVATPSFIPDQRRPGRLGHGSPALVPLLRKPGQYVDADDSDPLAPARSIAVGLLLSAPLWALIGLGVWFIL